MRRWNPSVIALYNSTISYENLEKLSRFSNIQAPKMAGKMMLDV